jgi:hypothetical protein
VRPATLSPRRGEQSNASDLLDPGDGKVRYPSADIRHAKALLAAEIINVLDGARHSTGAAEARTAVAHREFSRIRNERLVRFTFDRSLAILDELGQDVRMTVTVRPRMPADQTAT